MTALKKPDQRRSGLIAKVHIAKKSLALEDDNYRDLLKRVTGKTSSAKMTIKELEAVMDVFKQYGFMTTKRSPKRAGTKKMAMAPQASKIRALWLSLYHIGEIEDPSEEALTKFCNRSCGVEAMQWMTPAKANQVILALRGWMRRVNIVFPTADDVKALGMRRAIEKTDGDALMDYDALCSKIFLILHQAKLLKVDHITQDIEEMGFDRYKSILQIDAEDADRIIEKYGKRIRKVKSLG